MFPASSDFGFELGFIVLTALVLGGFGWFMVVVIKQAARAIRNNDPRRAEMARAVGGEWRGDAIYIPVDDTEAWICRQPFGGENPKVRTSMTIPMPGRLPPVSLTPEHAFTGLNRWLGGQDIEIGESDFDQQYEIRGQPEVLTALLGEEIREAIEALRQTTDAQRLEVHIATGAASRSTLTLKTPGWFDSPESLKSFTDRAFALSKKLTDHFMAPWREATALGLTFTTTKGTPYLSGEISGLSVDVRLTRDTESVLEVHVACRGPGGMHIVHKDHARHARPIDVRNPFVDRLISIAGDDASAISSLFTNQTFIDNLLQVVHAHPGSEVTETGVTLRMRSGWQTDLRPSIQRAVSLALALQDSGTRPLPKEQPTDETQSDGPRPHKQPTRE